MKSQNGWSVIPAAQDSSAFPGTNIVPIPGLRAGDAATLLLYVGAQFNKRVEPLVSGWCWGFANKVISGSSTVSNHASGTAIDLNAPYHPQFKSGTFTAKKVAAIRTILAECNGAIRWGGDYEVSRRDEMHFEINVDEAAVHAAVIKLQGGENHMITVTQPIAELLTLLGTGWPTPTEDGGSFVKSLAGQKLDEEGLEGMLNSIIASPQRRDLIDRVNAKPGPALSDEQKKQALAWLEQVKEVIES